MKERLIDTAKQSKQQNIRLYMHQIRKRNTKQNYRDLPVSFLITRILDNIDQNKFS